METPEPEASAWTQLKYEQKISKSCFSNMFTKWEQANHTVTLYQILHGDKLDKPKNLLYAPQIPRNFAAANKKTEHPDWYRLLVEPDLHDPDYYPYPPNKPALRPGQGQEDNPDIHHMLEIRNGFVKKASVQDVEYLRLLHDLVHKIEVIERQKFEELKSAAAQDSDDDEDTDEVIDEDNNKDQRNTSGIFKMEAIAPLRHVLYEFMHYNWNHKKMGLYCTEHLRQQWLDWKVKSAQHHAYILIQKLEEVAGLKSSSGRLTVMAGSGPSVEDGLFAASSIVHPLPHLVSDEHCTMDYFAELWEVTDIANDFIHMRRSDPASNADVLDVLQRLSNAWHQDLSLLYKKGSHLFFRELKEQNALQIASLRGIHSRVPNFCSLAVLPLWHNIPYVYARLKDAYRVSNETAEDLCQHLHIGYDDIITNLDDGDQQMEDADD